MPHRYTTLALLSAVALTGLTFAHVAPALGQDESTPKAAEAAPLDAATSESAAETATEAPDAETDWRDHGEGLQSRVITPAPADAATPKEDDAILVNMSMALADGTVIQSTEQTGPLTIPLADTTFLDGINIAVRLLHEGEKREFKIPPKLAFGEQGTPNGVIPPNATLTFTAELVDILPRLQVTTTAQGEGEPASSGDFVSVHYTGMIEGGEKDGEKFDSSHDHPGKEPLNVPLGAGRVIPGWEQGLIGIKPGEKRTLIIPPHLAYGQQGSGAKVPPNSTLKFEVECTAVKPGIEITTTKPGEGEPAKAGDMVTVHYTGTLHGGENDGEKFDSSRDRETPFTFPLGAGRVIKGWDVGVQGMKPGEQRTLIIPSPWGYGPYGAGDTIPGGATLKFDVELIKIN